MATVSPEEIPAHSDEDLTDLLSEIRLLLPGTQILVAFLVILPFNSGYTREAYSKGILEFIPGFDPNSTGGGKTFSRKFLAKAACRIGRRPE